MLLRSPGRFFGGTTLSCERANFNNPGDERNIFVGSAGVSPTGGQPNGVRHPYTWTMPKGPGGMATYENALGTGTISAGNLAGGKNGTADLTGLGEVLSATGDLIVSALATLSGQGLVTDANLQAFLNALADLSAGGDLDGVIDALGWAVASSAGTSTVALVPYATGTLDGDIVVGVAGELTAESIAASVWEALTSAYTTTGTMGKALQDASAAGNPWSANTASNNTAGTFGKLVQDMNTNVSDVETNTVTISSDIAALEALITAAAAKITELHQLQGLELGTPMTVTPTTRTAGTISLSISGDGTTTSTVERDS